MKRSAGASDLRPPPRRLRRRLLILLLCLATAFLGLGTVVMGPYLVRVRHFSANPSAGYHADFFVYVSPKSRQLARSGQPATLLVQPNNSGVTSNNPAVHRRDAWWMAFGRHWLADELGVVLLVPAFIRPADDWRVYSHALDRDVLTTSRAELRRLDLQLLAMVDRARAALAAESLPTEAKFLLQGFSASGMFANRFTMLHPGRVKAVAVGSPGGWPVAPTSVVAGEDLPYPAGVSDLDSLAGLPFDSLAYRSVPQLIVMGALDDNDGLDFTDGWDSVAAAQVDRLFGTTPVGRWRLAEWLYRSAGASAQFRLVPGVGHDRKALQPFSTKFFGELLANRWVKSPPGSEDADSVGGRALSQEPEQWGFSYGGIGLGSDLPQVARRFRTVPDPEPYLRVSTEYARDQIRVIAVGGSGRHRQVRISLGGRDSLPAEEYPDCSQIETVLKQSFGPAQEILHFMEETHHRSDRIWRSATEKLTLECFLNPEGRLVAPTVIILPRTAETPP